MESQIAEAVAIVIGACFAWGLYTFVARPLNRLLVGVRLCETGVQVLLLRLIPVKTIPFERIEAAYVTTRWALFRHTISGGFTSGVISVAPDGRKGVVVVTRNDGGADLICSPAKPGEFVEAVHAKIGTGIGHKAVGSGSAA